MGRDNFVLVSIVGDKHTAELQKGLLNENGIHTFIQAEAMATGVFLGEYGQANPPFAPWDVYVNRNDAKTAQDILSTHGFKGVKEPIPLVSKSARRSHRILRVVIIIILVLYIILFIWGITTSYF